MLERAIPIQQAFIRIYNNETHHVQRAVKDKEAVIIAYGELYSKKKMNIFTRLVARNANNYEFSSYRIVFVAKVRFNSNSGTGGCLMVKTIIINGSPRAPKSNSKTLR